MLTRLLERQYSGQIIWKELRKVMATKNTGFYFTQPDNAVMFDAVLTQTAVQRTIKRVT